MRPPRELIVLLGLSLVAATAAAHGTRTEVVVGPTTTVTVTSDHGEPLAGAGFTVLAPGVDEPWLTGTTDVQGRVAFRPDRAGDWRVRIASFDGHGALVTVPIDSAALAGATAGEPVGARHEHDHDHAPAPRHEHDHTPAGRSPAAAAGMIVLVIVLGVVYLGLRRRGSRRAR